MKSLSNGIGETLHLQAELSAKGGTMEFGAFWNDISPEDRAALLPDEDRLRALAAESDRVG